jgi:undecaprenyl diphosphate synthase
MSLDPNRVPKHVAVIMDGNGRWAELKGEPRVFGHRKGTDATRAVVRNCDDYGVQYLTLYVFSTENWKRPPHEVDFLMKLVSDMIDSEVPDMMKNNVKLKVLGQMNSLPEYAQQKLIDGMEKTKNNTGLNLQLAINYGGRSEIAEAVKQIASKVKSGDLEVDQIDEETISANMFLPEVPDPELLIRTGGEFRVSNYLLWQIAYSEIFVSEKLWPDFDKEELFNALEFYQNRQRRFGGIKADDE